MKTEIKKISSEDIQKKISSYFLPLSKESTTIYNLFDEKFDKILDEFTQFLDATDIRVASKNRYLDVLKKRILIRFQELQNENLFYE